MGISWGYIGFNHQQCFFSRDVKIAPGVSSKIHHDWGIYLFFWGGPDVPEANRSLGTGWGPPVISWFITPMNTIVISAINHRFQPLTRN